MSVWVDRLRLYPRKPIAPKPRIASEEGSGTAVGAALYWNLTESPVSVTVNVTKEPSTGVLIIGPTTFADEFHVDPET